MRVARVRIRVRVRVYGELADVTMCAYSAASGAYEASESTSLPSGV